MNVSQNNLDAVNAKLLVKIEPADYTEKVEKAVKDFRKKANMPGFRPGTVPVGLVKKMYGKSFLAEEVNKLISDALYDISRKKILIFLENQFQLKISLYPNLKMVLILNFLLTLQLHLN